MEPAVALQTLLHCLRDHGALLTRDDIEWAFNTDKNVKQIEYFIQKYLGTDSLLSLEEKTTYEALNSKDLLGSEIPPLSSKAVDDTQVGYELAEIQKQNKALKDNIDRVKNHSSNHVQKMANEKFYTSSHFQIQDQLQKSYLSEKDQNSAAIEDLEATFRAAFSDMQDASGKLNFQMSAMSEITRTDDRILARLQSIVTDILLAKESGGEDLIYDASHYSEILASLEEQIIKTRLDRVFLNHITSTSIENIEGQPLINSQEFNDLMVEISAVASMRSKDGLLQPILQQLTTDHKLRSGSMALRCNHILDTLDLLNSRTVEAEKEITTRNNMQYVSSRMQMLFELSMRDFHDARQMTNNVNEPLKDTTASQSQGPDERAYIEHRILRSIGVGSLTSGEGATKELLTRSTKLKSKEDLYKQLRTERLKYIQEENGVISGLETTINRPGRGGVSNTFSSLENVEGRVKSISAELGQLSGLANGKDMTKANIINSLKDKEIYGG